MNFFVQAKVLDHAEVVQSAVRITTSGTYRPICSSLLKAGDAAILFNVLLMLQCVSVIWSLPDLCVCFILCVFGLDLFCGNIFLLSGYIWLYARLYLSITSRFLLIYGLLSLLRENLRCKYQIQSVYLVYFYKR